MEVCEKFELRSGFDKIYVPVRSFFPSETVETVTLRHTRKRGWATARPEFTISLLVPILVIMLSLTMN